MDYIDVFEELLLEDGYKNSVATEYGRAIERVLENNRELETVDQLLQNIPYYIYAYAYGEKKRDNYSNRTVSSALKKFKEYFADCNFVLSVKFFDEESLSLEEYQAFKNTLNECLETVIPDGRRQEQGVVRIDSIKPGCSEFFTVFSNVMATVGAVSLLLDTYLIFKKILRGRLDKIEDLHYWQRKALLLITQALLLYMERHHQAEIELGLKTNKSKKRMTLTRECVEEIKQTLKDE